MKISCVIFIYCYLLITSISDTLADKVPFTDLTSVHSLPVNASFLHLCKKAGIWIKSTKHTPRSHNSLLRINRLQYEDSGLYECYNKKDISSLNLESVQLGNSRPLQRLYLYIEPPTTEKLQRVRRSSSGTHEIMVKVQGRKIILHCKLGGGEDFKGINVDMKNESERYSCMCSNCDEQSKSSNSRNLSPLAFAPITSTPDSNIQAKDGDTIYLTCNAKAEPMPVFQWYKISNTFSSSDVIDDLKETDRIQQSKKHAFLLDFIPEGFQSKLEIKNVTQSDYGNYLCVVKNNHGVGILIVTLHEFSDDTSLGEQESPSSGSQHVSFSSLIITAFFSCYILKLN